MSTDDQPSSSRKSTIRRYPSAGNLFASKVEFNPSLHEWQRLEAAISADLSTLVREEIVHIVDSYAVWSSAAKIVPPAIEVEQELEAIKLAAEELKRRLTYRSSVAAVTAVAGIYSGLHQSRSNNLRFLDELNVTLDDIVQSCNAEITKSRIVTDHKDEIDHWNDMVMRLNELLRASGLPDGITAGQNPSAFVLFIEEMQRIIPKDVPKRGTHSIEALAGALKRARSIDLNKRRFGARRSGSQIDNG